MKVLRNLLAIAFLAGVVSSCNTHKGQTCPAYRTSIDAPVQQNVAIAADEIAVESNVN